MKSMAFVSIPLLQAAELEPAGAYIPISFLPLVVLIGVIIAGVKYSRAFKKTGQKGAWKYLLGLYGIFLGFSILGRLMKNPAASSGVSSVEKKKSCGLFSFCTGEVSTPPSSEVEIEPPQGAGYSTPLRIMIPVWENRVIRVTITIISTVLGLAAGIYNCYRGLQKAKAKTKEIAAQALSSDQAKPGNVGIQTNLSERKITREDMAGKELRTNAVQKCPKCGSAEWRPLALPGYVGRGLLVILLGVIGNAIASSALRKKKDNAPFILKCEGCGEKWEAPPAEAAEEEWLESPCGITMSRPGGLVGAAVGQYVFLNGIRMGVLKNGGSLNFQTK